MPSNDVFILWSLDNKKIINMGAIFAKYISSTFKTLAKISGKIVCGNFVTQIVLYLFLEFIVEGLTIGSTSALINFNSMNQMGICRQHKITGQWVFEDDNAQLETFTRQSLRKKATLNAPSSLILTKRTS